MSQNWRHWQLIGIEILVVLASAQTALGMMQINLKMPWFVLDAVLFAICIRMLWLFYGEIKR